MESDFDPSRFDPSTPSIGGAVHVRFERRALKHEYKSAQAGRDIYDDTDFIVKVICGTNEVIDRPASKQDIDQFPVQYQSYLSLLGDGTPIKDGFPLTEVSWMSESRKQEWRAVKVFTLEQLADLPDSVLAKNGMGAAADRQKAQAQLKSITDSSYVNRLCEQVSEFKRITEDQAAELAELKALLKNGRPVGTVPSEVSESPKPRGRPRKIQEDQHESI